MGRYSRKHMIEFANFAKSYQSPRKVEDAYEIYLKGARIITKKDNLVLETVYYCKSNGINIKGNDLYCEVCSIGCRFAEKIINAKKIKNERRIRRQNEKKLRKQNTSSVTS